MMTKNLELVFSFLSHKEYWTVTAVESRQSSALKAYNSIDINLAPYHIRTYCLAQHLKKKSQSALSTYKNKISLQRNWIFLSNNNKTLLPASESGYWLLHIGY